MATRKGKIFVDVLIDPAQENIRQELTKLGYDVHVFQGDYAAAADCPERRAEILRQAKGSVGIMVIPKVGKIDREAMKAIGPQLKVICTYSVGVEHIDLEAAR